MTFWPLAPSFFSASSLGETAVISWTMIEADTQGMTLSAKTVIRPRLRAIGLLRHLLHLLDRLRQLDRAARRLDRRLGLGRGAVELQRQLGLELALAEQAYAVERPAKDLGRDQRRAVDRLRRI